MGYDNLRLLHRRATQGKQPGTIQPPWGSWAVYLVDLVGVRGFWACSVVAQSEADALSLWFRQTAAQQMGSAGLLHRSSVRRYRRLLGEAADSADQLMADDERLVRLDAGQRVTEFYGERLFVGGGPAIHHATLASIGDAEATGHTVLQAVITAALSEPAPG